MTTLVAEDLAGLDLDSVPPCEWWWWRPGESGILRSPYAKCENPSVVRLKLTCKVHGTTYKFTCQHCLDGIRSEGAWACHQCMNAYHSWEEA